MKPDARRSPLGLILLALLIEEPMHAYRMQALIRQRGKDQVVNVRQRASVYQTLERLLRLELIALQQTVQSPSHPDRAVYAITERGRETAKAWLCDMLAAVGGDFPDFAAAVSVLPMLTPDDAKAQLEARVAAIQTALRQLADNQAGAGGLPRLFLLEDEYRQAVLQAELRWLEGVIDDLGGDALSWDARWLSEIAEKMAQRDLESKHV